MQLIGIDITWRRLGRCALACLTVAVLGVLPRGASAEALPTLFAGTWNTSYPPFSGTGTLTLQATDSENGISALAVLGGPASGCSAPTVYYKGSYTAAAGEAGQVAGCTTDLAGLALTAYYGGASNGHHGNFSVSITCGEPDSFSGTYNELLGETTGNYAGLRTSASQSCPAGGESSGGGTAGKTTIPAPAAWNQSTAEATLAPGATIETQSPPLAPSQERATVTVPLKEADALALIAKNGPQKPGDCIYVGLASANVAAIYGLRFIIPFAFQEAFLECMSLLKSPAGASAAKAAASCDVAAAHVTQGTSRGRRYLEATHDRMPALIVSCARGRAGLAVHVRTRHGSLRSIVGSRLQVGLYRSRKAHVSTRIRVHFAAH